MESAKWVMTIAKLDNKLAGQSSTPYTSLKNTPFCKEQKIVKFDEYKLLYNQIDRLTEVLDRMNTRPQGRQIQQSQPYKPYIHTGRGRGYNSFWVMTAIEEVINKGPVTGIEEDIPLDPNPEDIIL